MKTILSDRAPDRRKRRGSSSRALRWTGGIALVAAAAFLVVAAVAGFFDRDPIRLFGDFGRGRVPVVALFFSGDMGLRFGMGPHVTQALAARGIPVMGVNSPTIFGRHRSRAEVDALVAGAVRSALDRAHADRVVLIGQSFGSDILGTGAAAAAGGPAGEGRGDRAGGAGPDRVLPRRPDQPCLSRHARRAGARRGADAVLGAAHLHLWRARDGQPVPAARCAGEADRAARRAFPGQ